MSVPKSRLLDLMKVQCKVFATTFNPEQVRLGNGILRQRLRGPALASYYPKRHVTFRDIIDTFGPDLTTYNEEALDRKAKLDGLRSRGKGNAKRKADAASGKKKKK